MPKSKTLIICLLMAAMLCFMVGCAKDEPAKEASEAEDFKVLQRPGVELSFSPASSDGSYSITAATIFVEAEDAVWVLPLTQEEHDYLMSGASSNEVTTFDHLRQKFGEYKIEDGVLTVDPFAP